MATPGSPIDDAFLESADGSPPATDNTGDPGAFSPTPEPASPADEAPFDFLLDEAACEAAAVASPSPPPLGASPDLGPNGLLAFPEPVPEADELPAALHFSTRTGRVRLPKPPPPVRPFPKQGHRWRGTSLSPLSAWTQAYDLHNWRFEDMEEEPPRPSLAGAFAMDAGGSKPMVLRPDSPGLVSDEEASAGPTQPLFLQVPSLPPLSLHNSSVSFLLLGGWKRRILNCKGVALATSRSGMGWIGP